MAQSKAGPMPPKSAPPSIPYLRQACEDMPKLREEERKAILRVEVWKKNLAQAEATLMDVRLRIAKKEACMASAVSSLQREEEEKTKKLAAEQSQATGSSEPRPRPSKARKLG